MRECLLCDQYVEEGRHWRQQLIVDEVRAIKSVTTGRRQLIYCGPGHSNKPARHQTPAPNHGTEEI